VTTKVKPTSKPSTKSPAELKPTSPNP
jgi:hypothetical protein